MSDQEIHKALLETLDTLHNLTFDCPKDMEKSLNKVMDYIEVLIPANMDEEEWGSQCKSMGPIPKTLEESRKEYRSNDRVGKTFVITKSKQK